MVSWTQARPLQVWRGCIAFPLVIWGVSAYALVMSIFGRKTFRAGPFRATLSQSGLSSSVGGKRARVRTSTKGRKGASVNLGEGFRWTRSWK